MFYLTFNEQPSGVYSSQVTDVVSYIRQNDLARMRLVAFISLRGFSENRKRILSEAPGSWVIPIFPRGTQRWFSTVVLWLLCLFTGERSILCRNVSACMMALQVRRSGIKLRIGYDGRGAIAAEWNEYDVVPSEKQKREIASLEKQAVLESDFRIAVSQKLVEYWQQQYGYKGTEHTVIPCTVTSTFTPGLPAESELSAIRASFGFTPADLVLVYSGSTAGWQSFGTLEKLLADCLRSSPDVKLIFLTGKDPVVEKMKTDHPGQVQSRWLKHHEVTGMLLACDIGILYREQSVTNKVASPTKFAEYLSAGLPVVISEGLGDYSRFVE